MFMLNLFTKDIIDFFVMLQYFADSFKDKFVKIRSRYNYLYFEINNQYKI